MKSAREVVLNMETEEAIAFFKWLLELVKFQEVVVPDNGAKIFANAFRSYLINLPNMLRPLLCIHPYEISHETGHR